MLPREPRLPSWVKIAYTAFVCVLVPNYWRDYGPTNFLYFCDVALLMGLVAVWTERPIWASAPAVGILLPQTFWIVDFLGSAVGYSMTGMTAYMFKPEIPLFTRGLSFFHFWLPFFLLYLVWHLGYDRRAFLVWTIVAWCLLVVCYFFMPAPPGPTDQPNLPVNINYVYGLSDKGPQTWLPGPVYFGLLLIGLPAMVFYPTHRLLGRFFGRQIPTATVS